MPILNRPLSLGWAALPIAIASLSSIASAQTVEDLRHMSLEELADVTVSSVLKTDSRLSEAPAAIYVISQADIQRSGATTLPEALRLAPNLQVAQVAASQYVITARGMSGNETAQNFPNKLLILIDGRSVYSPLFSGVYWDAQDVLLADIDRIEVISGPGATLWGANAINGVINIITRSAGDTQGVLVDAAVGTQELLANARYGGSVGPNLSYRIYAKAFRGDQTQTAARVGAQDSWDRAQGGFRLDWKSSDEDLITLQGDAFQAEITQGLAPEQTVRGRNLLARWTRLNVGGETQIQAYFDRLTRRDEAEGIDLNIDTYDLELKKSFVTGVHSLVMGGGVRWTSYETFPIGGLSFSPANRNLTLANIFIQDSISIGPSLKATVGVKLEDGAYTGVDVLPNLRLAWQPQPDILFWGAASRAIRSPTPFDTNVVETVASQVLIIGDPNYRTEKVTALELGTRFQPSTDVSVSVSTFYNMYDDLRSIEPAPVGFFPLRWGNKLQGKTYGLEAWADFKLAPYWKVSATYGLLLGDFRFDPDASKLLGLSQVRNDPKHQASLRTSVNLGPNVTVDANLRYVGRRPQPRVAAYTELNAQLGWRVSDQLQLTLSGSNLFHDSHFEYVSPGSNRIARRVLAGLRWQP